MTTYLTWLPEEHGGHMPDAISAYRAFNARLPREAAEAAALRAAIPKHPFDVTVGVVRAEDVGTMGMKVRRYHVEFSRSVWKVTAEK